MAFQKSLFVTIIATLLFVSCKENNQVTTSKKEVTTKKTAIVGKIETASFKIEGMSCAVMCAAKIEKELAQMEGVQDAKVDFDKKTATIKYDNAKQTPQKFVQKAESVADGKTYKVSDLKIVQDKV